jgi:TRAP-type C4-dicarboxylate transport system permease small subunit
MQRLKRTVSKISQWMNTIGAVALAFMILLTVADVILRSFRKPIIGTYELVGLTGAVIIGFSIPLTSWVKGHIHVDFFLLRLSMNKRKVFNIITKSLGIALFFIIGWNLFILGMDIYKAREVTPTRHIPIHPVIYGLGVCCFFQCLVLFCDILKLFEKEYE